MVYVYLASLPGTDEKGRDIGVRVARLAAVLTQSGLKPKLAGKGTAEGCTVAVLCLTSPLVQLSAVAEYSSLVATLGRERMLLVAMEPSCAAPLPSGTSALLKLLHPPGIRSMVHKPIDLSADGAAFAEGAGQLVAAILTTASSMAAEEASHLNSGGPSSPDEKPSIAALAAKRLAESPRAASPIPAAPLSPAHSPGLKAAGSGFANEENSVGLRPSEVKAQAAARMPPSPLGGPSPPRPGLATRTGSALWQPLGDEGASGMKPSEVKAAAAQHSSPITSRGSKRNSTTLVPIAQLSVTETIALMSSLGLGKYNSTESFKDARMTGVKLDKSDDASLEALGLSGLHRRTLLGRLDEFRAHGVPGSLLL
ncbi:hypothetical protein T492DRAFT_998418 [Pavlovales sp. CCMP2436]|nr:hypothetical protein T492DRAFT_998418 [Pavlovales sp. CCMP2436]|mmetsp:Transcript_26895/g.68127  ORF Transcript_26895/g.68127 Transcript_26895/m.68127 type:complete len:368 (+) Transcript_26895:126-1229(+)